MMKYHKAACTDFLMMNSQLFKTCWKQYNWIKSLMIKVCILLVLLTYAYHDAWFKNVKGRHNSWFWISVTLCHYKSGRPVSWDVEQKSFPIQFNPLWWKKEYQCTTYIWKIKNSC